MKESTSPSELEKLMRNQAKQELAQRQDLAVMEATELLKQRTRDPEATLEDETAVREQALSDYIVELADLLTTCPQVLEAEDVPQNLEELVGEEGVSVALLMRALGEGMNRALGYVGVDLEGIRKHMKQKEPNLPSLQREIVMLLSAAIQIGNNPEKLLKPKGPRDKEIAKEVSKLCTKYKVSMGKEHLVTLNTLSLAYLPIYSKLRIQAQSAELLQSQFDTEMISKGMEPLNPIFQAPAMGPLAAKKSQTLKDQYLAWSAIFTKALDVARFEKEMKEARTEAAKTLIQPLKTEEECMEDAEKWLKISIDGYTRDIKSKKSEEAVQSLSPDLHLGKLLELYTVHT
jgi:hypothetical protein